MDHTARFQTHQQFYATGCTREAAYRRNALQRLETAILHYEQEILTALHEDLGKAAFEGFVTEVGLVLEELKTTIGHVMRWSKPRKAHSPLVHFPSCSRIYPSPYGVVLIMSPWNYPFQLTMVPLIGAIAAGNVCLMKPSEYAPHTADVIQVILSEVFPEEYVSVVRGGRTANQSLLTLPFDYIFFTGSPTVGHVVMESAAKHLIPITLELGGKSPCVVDETAQIETAARRIIWGKLLNAGQTCVAPDYILVHRSVQERLVAAMKDAIGQMFGEHPLTHADYPKIINEKHFHRLQGLLSSGQTAFGGGWDEGTMRIEPTLLTDVEWTSPVMQEEIFGPILPILTFDQLEEAWATIETHPHPLAFYYFTQNKSRAEEAIHRLSFGGGCINDVVIHVSNGAIPFGGMGNSGMGKYHGKATFDTFTHEKSVMHRGTWLDIPLRYAPYHQRLKQLRRWLG